MNDLMKTPLFLLAVFVIGNVLSASDPPATVSDVNLDRYIGIWYEIARMPNRFQKQCAAGTTAEYSLMEDGRIRVVNRCYKSDGTLDEARGVARVVDSQTKAKLQVSFVRILGRNRFWGDYWILGLDENYQWAVIGHPKRKYGWILSRAPQIEPNLRSRIGELLREKGYNPDDFIDTLPRYQ